VLKEIKTFEVLAGTAIEEAVREALSVAKRNACVVRFRFNGVDMEVCWFDEVEEKVAEYFDRLHKGGDKQ